MSAPYNDGRDSSAAPANSFADADSVADENAGTFRGGFTPLSNQLAEEDYRDSPAAGPQGSPPSESSDSYTYPTARPGGHLGF